MKKPRSRKDMIKFLSEHFRYHTMNSWNLSTSYAQCVKIHRFVPSDVANGAYDFLQVNGAFEEGRSIMREFDRRHNWEWQMGTNGRSGGYIVLYQGGTKPSGYKRYCTYCGQKNYRRGIPQEALNNKSPEGHAYLYALTHTMWVPEVYPEQSEMKALKIPREKVIEIVKRAKEDVKKNGEVGGNQCGRCNIEGGMVDYDKTHMTVYSRPGLGVDENEDFEDWDYDSLKDRVDLVWDFDQTIEKVKTAFVNFVRKHKVVEKEIMIPKTIHVAVLKKGGKK